VVLREVDDAEAALADQVEDLELAELGAGRQRVLVQARRRGLGAAGGPITWVLSLGASSDISARTPP
jgi:hypothetical protein